MSKKDKLLARIKQSPSDYRWTQFVALFNFLGYELVETGGSHCYFVNEDRDAVFHTFRPHVRRENSMPKRVLAEAVEHLTQQELI